MVRTIVYLESLAGGEESSQLIPARPLVNKPGPSSAAGKKNRASIPTDATATSALWRWCPLHETSLHDMTMCRYFNSMVEDRKRRLAESAATGLARTSCDCPDKVACPSGLGAGAVYTRRTTKGAALSATTQEELPRVMAPALSMLAAGKATPRNMRGRPDPSAATVELPPQQQNRALVTHGKICYK
jgi:hypothetical protein